MTTPGGILNEGWLFAVSPLEAKSPAWSQLEREKATLYVGSIVINSTDLEKGIACWTTDAPTVCLLLMAERNPTIGGVLS